MKERLLLHACCAPCMSGCVPVLDGSWDWRGVIGEAPDFDVTVYFYNPNIAPSEEYVRRRDEARKLAERFGLEFIEGGYDYAGWDTQARQWKDEPERGLRCTYCYAVRLREAFRYAKAHGFGVVATTLTLSPLKNTAAVNEAGIKLALELERETGVRYLVSDFKKKDGYRKSVQFCRENGIYRQDYCGCAYSFRFSNLAKTPPLV